MASYGLTSSGFVSEPLAQIILDLQAAFQAAFGTDIDLDPEGPFGLLIGILAERESTLWQAGQDVYSAAYPDTASDSSLDDICSITGAVRLIATLSQDSLVAVGTNGTSVPAATLLATSPNALQFSTLETTAIATLSAWVGSTSYSAFTALAVGSLVTNGGNIYACVAAGESASSGGPTGTGTSITDGGCTWRYVAAGSAAVGVLVAATSTGPITAPSGSLTVVTSPVAGLASVVNPVDATPGRNVETDAALRIRRASLLEASGSAPLLALRAALLQLSGVTSASVYSNDTDTTDGAGRPPHSVECVVNGTATANAIAQCIWDNKATGINTTGGASGTATDPVTGTTYSISYTVPSIVQIYVNITLTPNPATYAGDTAVQNAIANFALGLDADIPGATAYGVGQTVFAGPIAASVFDQVAGVEDIATCYIKAGSGPATASTPITMTYAQLPQIQTANITVTS